MKTKSKLRNKSFRILASLTFTILLVTLAQVNLRAQGTITIINYTDCDFTVKTVVYSTRNVLNPGPDYPNVTVNTTTNPSSPVYTYINFGTDSSDLLSVILDPNTPGLGDQHIDCGQNRQICLCGYVRTATISCTPSSAPNTPASVVIEISDANTPPDPCN